MRARLRARKPYVKRNMMNFRAEARFPRARPSRVRQSILLITEMIFDYLIVTVSLIATEIGMSEVAKKVHTSTPPNVPVNGR